MTRAPGSYQGAVGGGALAEEVSSVAGRLEPLTVEVVQQAGPGFVAEAVAGGNGGAQAAGQPLGRPVAATLLGPVFGGGWFWLKWERATLSSRSAGRAALPWPA